MSLREVERRLGAVLEQSAGLLPPEKIEEIASYAAANEPAVALEDYCTYIYDHDLRPADAIVQALREIAAMMKVKLPPWIGNPSWVPPIRDN